MTDLHGCCGNSALALGARNNIFDHFDQAHTHAVIGVINTTDAVFLQCSDFIQRDGAATTAKYLDMPCPALF